MGAAIPHLATLTVSLPLILPFASDEITTEVLTGTVEVQDEVIPEDEDEDVSYQTRIKSSMSVVIKIGDGVDEVNVGGSKGSARDRRRRDLSAPAKESSVQSKGGKTPEQIVVQEAEQSDMDDT